MPHKVIRKSAPIERLEFTVGEMCARNTYYQEGATYATVTPASSPYKEPGTPSILINHHLCKTGFYISTRESLVALRDLINQVLGE